MKKTWRHRWFTVSALAHKSRLREISAREQLEVFSHPRGCNCDDCRPIPETPNCVYGEEFFWAEDNWDDEPNWRDYLMKTPKPLDDEFFTARRWIHYTTSPVTYGCCIFGRPVTVRCLDGKWEWSSNSALADKQPQTNLEALEYLDELDQRFRVESARRNQKQAEA